MFSQAGYTTTGNDYNGYLAPVEASEADPLALHAHGIRWWKANGGYALTEELLLPPSKLAAVDHFEARVGQHAGDAPPGGHGSLSWLLIDFGNGTNVDTTATVAITLTDCDVTTCGPGNPRARLDPTVSPPLSPIICSSLRN